MPQLDSMESSLGLAARPSSELVDAVYQRFFSSCPAAQTIFKEAGTGAQRRMVSGLIQLLFDQLEKPQQLAQTLKQNPGIDPQTHQLYDALVASVIVAVRERCVEHWNEDTERAWREAGRAFLAALQPEQNPFPKLLA